MEVEDGLLLPRLEPVIAGHDPMLFAHAAVALAPVVELASRQLEPGQEGTDREFGQTGPVGDEVQYFIAQVMGNPAAARVYNGLCKWLS